MAKQNAKAVNHYNTRTKAEFVKSVQMIIITYLNAFVKINPSSSVGTLGQ